MLSTAYYFDKKIAKLQSQLPVLCNNNKRQHSQKIAKLYQKKHSQIKRILHSYANHIRDYCKKKDICTVIIGDLTNLKKGKNFGKKTNLQIHSWRYRQFTEMLQYKLAEVGISLCKISERYTSLTCPVCGDCTRKNRITRGNYKCSQCGYSNHSDIIGAMNILTKYQQGDLKPSCNSHVNLGYVVKFDPSNLTCTEATTFR